jgi:eukaryotic-like serine/threonine-protein kinase
VPLAAAESSQVLAVELTQTGEIMGTPAYMSPEQARHENVDARSDQYSFCVALYEALFGMRPHAGRSTAEVLVAVADGEVRSPPRNTKVPTRVVRAIMRGLSADPAQRFPSMDALLEQLAPQDRGRWRVLGAGVVATAGLGVFMALGEAPCPSFRDDLAAAWGPERRAEVEAAFAASGAVGARSSLELTGDRLEAYARDWLGARRDACEAHLVRREQSAELHDRRVACLFERRAELAALAHALASADAGVVERAPLAAAELTPVADCADLERLQRQGEVDPVRQDLRVRLAQAQAQYKVGHYEPALEALAAVARAAHEHGAPALEAAGLFHRGSIHQRRRAHASANEAFEQAADLAEAGADDELAAEAWIYLARSQAMVGRIEVADQSVRRAWAKARRLGEARLEHAVRESQAVVAWQAERFSEAIEGQGLVVEWVRDTFGEQHPRTADAEHRYANILSGAGRHAEAQQRYAKALTVLEQTLGAEHPELARVWFDMGVDHHDAGHDADAVQALEQAERRFAAAVGPRAPELVELNKLLAHLAQRLGNLDEADRRMKAQMELAGRGGLPPQEHLDLLSLEAMVASQRRNHAQAITACRAYLERFEAVPRTADLEVQALFMRAILVTELGAVGRYDEAEPVARRLVDELAHLGDDPSVAALRAHAWLVLGRAAEARGQRGPAAEAYREGLDCVARADLAATEPRTVRARLGWGLGRVLPPSETVAARTLVSEAREALASAEPSAPELAEIDAWLRTAG